MKNIKLLLFLITAAAFTSCEEVVDVDLTTAAPRLVVEASIDWMKGTDGSLQTVKLTTTTGYYETQIPVVSGATVTVTNSENIIFDFIENPGTGEYICINFIPVIGETYTLTVIHDGQTYTATETMYAVPEIGEIVQDNEGGFLGDNIEVRFFYQDDPLADNYYLTRYDTAILPYPEYNVSEDRFFQGNEMFGIFSDEDLKQGDVLKIQHYGISRRYYNYMLQLIAIASGGAGSGPFQSVPANVSGNIVNQTNQENYALGYFRLSEADTVSYTVQ